MRSFEVLERCTKKRNITTYFGSDVQTKVVDFEL
jgi:hypothetical protein